MAHVRGFHIPEDLHYWVDKHVWVRVGADGVCKVGLTPVAYHLLHHSLEAITVQQSALGSEVPRGKSVVMVESVKYIGGVPAPFAGVVLRANEHLAEDPENQRAARRAKAVALAGRHPSSLGPDYLESLRQEWAS